LGQGETARLVQEFYPEGRGRGDDAPAVVSYKLGHNRFAPPKKIPPSGENPKSRGWDASTRNALRDFKVVNSLANDDAWDAKTSRKLNSETAIHAYQSTIGNWSTGSCRSSAPAFAGTSFRG
jgi:hypothetical protein